MPVADHMASGAAAAGAGATESRRPPGWRRRRAGARRGVASIEFALVATLLLLLSFGTVDLIGLLRAQQRADAAAQQLGQLTSQCNRIVTPGDIEQFWGYAQAIVGGAGNVTGSDADGAVVVTAVGRAENGSNVAWQFRTGSSAHSSAIGTAGGAAALPGGADVPIGQTMLVIEVFVVRDDWVMSSPLMGGTSKRTLHGIAFFLTRATDAPALLIPPANDNQPVCTG